MDKDTKDLVNTLIDQQMLICKMLEITNIPVKKPPIKESALKNIIEDWAKEGIIVPQSYRNFLEVCDGIRNFSLSYHLLGSKHLLHKKYKEFSSNYLEEWIGFDYELDKPPIIIGYSKDTSTKVFFHPSYEREMDDELTVFDGEPGNICTHSSFYLFLKNHVESNTITIKSIEKLKNE